MKREKKETNWVTHGKETSEKLRPVNEMYIKGGVGKGDREWTFCVGRREQLLVRNQWGWGAMWASLGVKNAF